MLQDFIERKSFSATGRKLARKYKEGAGQHIVDNGGRNSCNLIWLVNGKLRFRVS